MKITIGIVTRRRKPSLSLTLQSIKEQRCRPYEVIVVENDDTLSVNTVADNYKSSFKVSYFLVKRLGIAECRNKVLDRAKGEVITFIDDDCILDKLWTENLIKSFNLNGVVAVVGRSLNFYDKNPIASLEQDIYETWFKQYVDLNGLAYLKSGMFVNTRNFGVKKSFLDKYPLRFNPKAPHKIEDTDFGIRLFEKIKADNKKILYNPQVRLLHKNSTSLFSFLKRRSLSKSGADWLIKKYPGFNTLTKIDNAAYAKLTDKNGLARILFDIEGFIQRQTLRIKYLFEKKEILLNIEKKTSIKL